MSPPDYVQKQIALMRLRRQALQLALRLFEEAADASEFQVIAYWFEQSNSAAAESCVVEAITHLTRLAHAKDLSLDP